MNKESDPTYWALIDSLSMPSRWSTKDRVRLLHDAYLEMSGEKQKQLVEFIDEHWEAADNDAMRSFGMRMFGHLDDYYRMITFSLG